MFRKPARQETPDPGGAVAPPPAEACPLLRPFLKRVERLQSAPRVLLFGEMCGANVSFLGERGYRIAFEGSPLSPSAYEGVYAGALLWDLLSLMKPEVALQWVSRIAGGLIAGGAALAFFPPASGPAPCPRTRFRILSEELIGREILAGRSTPAQPYQNRDIIRLFDGFDLDLLHTHRNGHREALFFKGRPEHLIPETNSQRR